MKLDLVNFNNFLIFVIGLQLSSCSFFESYIRTRNVNSNVSQVVIDPLAKGNAAFTTRSILRNSSAASIDVTCTGTSTHFIVSLLAPNLDTGNWIDCAGQTIALPLTQVTSGVAETKIWFKSTVGLTSTPQSVNLRKGNSYAFQIPLIDLGTGNLAAAVITELNPFLFVVPDPNNDVNGVNAGAFHLMNNSGQFLKTVRGATAGDLFGQVIIKLQGNRFAVLATGAATGSGAISQGGAVYVYDYSGEELFRIEGDTTGDKLGEKGFIELTNGNFVITTPFDDVAAITNAGSVQLRNGTTGQLISMVAGDVAQDKMGSGAWNGVGNVQQLATGFVLISSSLDNIFGGAATVGSLKFMDPDTGVVISTINGQTANDQLGSFGIQILPSGTIVVRSSSYTIGGFANYGRYTFVNPSTGIEITTINGEADGILLGYYPLVQLTNGNLVAYTGFSGPRGLIKLINGTTFAEIATVKGLRINAYFSEQGVMALSNGNFVVLSEADELVAFNRGRAALIDGATGAVINNYGADVFGGDNIEGFSLDNGNYVVVFPAYGGADEGRMTIHNGTTGAILGTLNGAVTDDLISLFYKVTLANSHFIISFNYQDPGGIVDGGCIYYYNGNNGALLNSICGDEINERLGLGVNSKSSDQNIFISSMSEKVAGIVLGSVRIFNGTTGTIIQTFYGVNAGDYGQIGLLASDVGTMLIAAPSYDSPGVADGGRAMVVNTSTGAILADHYGAVASDQIGSGGAPVLSASGHFVLLSPAADRAGMVNSGSVMFLNKTTGAVEAEVLGTTADDQLGLIGIQTFQILSNGDYLFRASNSDLNGVSNSGAYIVFPMD